MRILTVRQPWATLIAIGAKQIETRSRRTHYRGPVAIHAGASKQHLRLAETFSQWAGSMWARFPKVSDLPLGAVVAVADLVDCIEMTEANIQTVSLDERRFGNYETGHFMWQLSSVRPLDKPIPAKGRLGLWVPDQDMIDELSRQGAFSNG